MRRIGVGPKMIFLLRHKINIIWFSFTLLACFLSGCILMYQRDITLDNVRSIDFKLISRFVDISGLDIEKNKSSLKAAIDVLTYKNQYVLFPVAVIQKESCFENGPEDHKNSLCPRFKNTDVVEKLVKDKVSVQYYGVDLIKDGSRHFMIKKLQNSENWLIGDAGYYLYFSDNQFARLNNFLSNKLGMYFTPFGTEQMYKKSWGLWVYIIILSTFFHTIFTLNNRRNNHKYLSLLKEKEAVQGDWVEANENLNIYKSRKKQMSRELALKEQQLVALGDGFDKEQYVVLDLEEEIKILKSDNEKLTKQVQTSQEMILDLEIIEDVIEEKERNVIQKMGSSDVSEDHKKLKGDFKRLTKLWRLEPKWSQRTSAESDLAPNDGKVPFTLTQAFMSFENYLVEWVEEEGFDDTRNDLSLNDCIGLLMKNNIITQKEKNFFHEIRMQRNNWFHEAAVPNQRFIDQLLTWLQDKGIKPLL